MQILNIEDNNILKNRETIDKNYKHLFDVNDKSKGGSFYLQSKVCLIFSFNLFLNTLYDFL
jgi:import inner membrane translocase subunit TIM16